MFEHIRSRRVIAAEGRRLTRITCFGIAATSCVGADLMLPTPLSLGCAALLYLCFSTWLSVAEARRAMLTLSPLVCYQAWQTVTLGVASLYMAFAYGGSGSVPFGGWQVPMSRVAYGHAIMVAGSWAFYAGMRHFKPLERTGQPHRVPVTATSTLVSGFVLGVAFLIGREIVTQFAGSVVAQLSYLPLAVLSMLALRPPGILARSESAHGLVLLIGSACLLLINARRDSKMELMLSFFPLVWWLVKRGKTSLVLVAGSALAAVYLIGIAPLVSNMRVSGARNESGAVTTIAPEMTDRVVQQLFEEFSSNPVDYIEQWLNATMNRLSDPVAAGMVVWITDQHGFLYGLGFDYLPVMLIPRSLWWDKPTIDRGRQFTAALGAAADASTATTSIGQTSAGELFWNFGWAGVIVGMYILGAAISGLWWGPAGGDPRRGLLEMTAYVSAMLSFVLVCGAAAGPVLIGCITAGLFFRMIIRLRQWLFPRPFLEPSLRVSDPALVRDARYTL